MTPIRFRAGTETGWPFRYYDGPISTNSKLPKNWNYFALAFDLSLGLLTFYAVGVLGEWLTCRNESMKMDDG